MCSWSIGALALAARSGGATRDLHVETSDEAQQFETRRFDKEGGPAEGPPHASWECVADSARSGNPARGCTFAGERAASNPRQEGAGAASLARGCTFAGERAAQLELDRAVHEGPVHALGR